MLDSITPFNPTEILVHQRSRILEVEFSDGRRYRIPFELMRVFSPSAEVQGHGPGQETLQTGKREVEIVNIEPVGHYGIKPVFSDGHDSGIFTWSFLANLGENETTFWNQYHERLHKAGLLRDESMPSKQSQKCTPHH